MEHLKEVAGMDMKQLARVVVDLHYECFPEFFLALAEELTQDAVKDFLAGKNLTATKLKALAGAQLESVERSRKLWEAVQKYMETDVNNLAS